MKISKEKSVVMVLKPGKEMNTVKFNLREEEMVEMNSNIWEAC
jgi:hypothetical protein